MLDAARAQTTRNHARPRGITKKDVRTFLLGSTKERAQAVTRTLRSKINKDLLKIIVAYMN